MNWVKQDPDVKYLDVLPEVRPGETRIILVPDQYLIGDGHVMECACSVEHKIWVVADE